MLRIMDIRMLFLLCYYLTNTGTSSRVKHHKIIQSVNVVLSRSVTLQIVAPNMQRPVVWRSDNHKHECTDTCTTSPDFRVKHKGNLSTLWIRKVTEDCLTWTFYDHNLNVGKIYLNKNGLISTETYEMVHGDNGTHHVSATLTTEIPNMIRPVVWRFKNYKYECDRICANSDLYKVTHSGNTSTFWIRNVTRERLSWTFYDEDFHYRKFDLKINSLTRSETYNIIAHGTVVLGSSITLFIEVPNMEQVIVWKNGYRNLECDEICYKYDDYEVRHIGNISTLLIRNVTEKDLTWSFCDRNHCSPEITLEIKDALADHYEETRTRISRSLIIALVTSLSIIIIIVLAILTWKNYKKLTSFKLERSKP